MQSSCTLLEALKHIQQNPVRVYRTSFVGAPGPHFCFQQSYRCHIGLYTSVWRRLKWERSASHETSSARRFLTRECVYPSRKPVVAAYGEEEPIPTSTTSTEETSRATTPRHYLLRFLYASHLLSKWGDRMWEFAVGLLMIEIWPNSLVLAAIYGLTEAGAVGILGVVVGNWVDRTPRLKVVRISLVVQNISIVVAGVAVVVLLAYPESVPIKSLAFVSLVVTVNLFGAIAALCGLASNIVVERDWVVVIAENQPPGVLAQINSVMRRIDLSCKLLAPVFVGFLMSGASPLVCAMAIAVWNLLSVGFEYKLLHSVYWSIPALQGKKLASMHEEKSSSVDEVVRSGETYHSVQSGENEHDASDDAVTSKGGLLRSYLDIPYIQGWMVYLRQEVVLAGVALALLYFTVLSFGSLMTAVLDWRGVPPYVLGLARAVAALVGILATVAYPKLHSRLNTVRTGLWSIWIQWSLLSLCATSILVHNGIEASVMLIAGVASSRFGLWMFDLAVSQLMQDCVPENERGTVGGVQSSLQSMMEMLSYVLGIIISDPKDFWIPVMLSYAAVGLAAVLYATYSHQIRGHLLHIDKIFRRL